MAASVWTNASMHRMFQLLPIIEVNGKQVGFYNNKWKTYPEHFNSAEWTQAMEILYAKLKKEKVFRKKEPKSARAVEMQIQHCVWPNPNLLFRKLRSVLRFSAYLAGFMEMQDIVELEQRADKIKLDKSVDPNA